MPRASDLVTLKKLRLMVYAMTGGGKTSLFRTLPGKKLLLVFDPAGLCSLQPTDDIEFETFIPSQVNMAISTIKGMTNSEVRYSGSDTYKQFEKYWDAKLEEGYFSQFDWVGFDSATTLQSLMMDEIANIYGREGKNPDLADYGIMAGVLERCMRSLTGAGCNIFCSFHEKANQDKLTHVISNGIMVPGQMQQKLPLLFSDIYHLYGRREGDKVLYFADTAVSEEYPLARCSLHLPTTIDLSIPEGVEDPTLYGFGKILREKGFYNENANENK